MSDANSYDGRSVSFFPIAIGIYRSDEIDNLDAEVQAGRLLDLLSDFETTEWPWRVPSAMRGADAVQQRLFEWATHKRPAYLKTDTDAEDLPSALPSSILYWVGHGWSDGRRSVLAHSYSPDLAALGGISPPDLAYAIYARHAQSGSHGFTDEHADGWSLVVIDTCRSTQFVDAITRRLLEDGAPERILLVGVSSEGATSLGRFVEAFGNILTDTFQTERTIELHSLAAQLERVLGAKNVYARGLGRSALVRTHAPISGWISAPMDEIRHLEDVLETISPDERWHFLSKARGAEHGELSWFFKGREVEMSTVVDWLHNVQTGLLVVCGAAGSGKSALLGNLWMHSFHELRDALARRALLSSNGPAWDVARFDAVVHLSGLSLRQTVARIASSLGFGSIPSMELPSLGVADDVEWLMRRVADHASTIGRTTILVDALDEAINPIDTGRALLSRLASVHGVRLIVGTRASAHESPDAPASDRTLIDALVGSGVASSDSDVIWLAPDQSAIGDYVTTRLRYARDFGEGGIAGFGSSNISDADIDRAATLISLQQREFLYARLAVYELIEDPSLLMVSRSNALDTLLGGNHQDIFASAVSRLGRVDDRYPFLLEALSISRGRGFPEADGVWASVAASLMGSNVMEADSILTEQGASTNREWSRAIHGVLDRAAPYVTVDNQLMPNDLATRETSGIRTVYRLAHRTFVEYFRSDGGPVNYASATNRACDALLGLAADLIGRGRTLGSYLSRNLSGHIAAAGRWDHLAGPARFVDMLSPEALSSDAIHALFGRHPVPQSVAGVIGARDALAKAALGDRRGIRQLASTVFGDSHRVVEPTETWGIHGAQVGEQSLHIRLAGHSAVVNKVCSVSWPDGRSVVASCSDDGSIRLWDPLTLSPIGPPLVGHAGTVEDLCCYRDARGDLRVASVGSDGSVRVWDPVAGIAAGPPLIGHSGPIWAVCAIPSLRESESIFKSVLLASGGADGTIRLWDPELGVQVGPMYEQHQGPVWALCTSVLHEDAEPDAVGPLLISGGVDAKLHFWRPGTGEAFASLPTDAGPIRGLCLVNSKDDPTDAELLVASAGSDGTIRLWDTLAHRQVGQPLEGHVGQVRGVFSFRSRTGASHSSNEYSAYLGSTGSDSTVRLWHAPSGTPAGVPFVGHVGTVFGGCAYTPTIDGVDGVDGEHTWIASAGGDGTVRIWDSKTIGAAAEVHKDWRSASPIYAITSFDATANHAAAEVSIRAVSAGASGAICIWDPIVGVIEHTFASGHSGPIHALGTLRGLLDPSAAGRFLSAGEDGVLRVWNGQGQLVGTPMDDQAGPIYAVQAMSIESSHEERRVLVACGGGDGTIRTWEYGTESRYRDPILAHNGFIQALCAIPSDGSSLLASAGSDGLIRVWDIESGVCVAPPCIGHIGTIFGLSTTPSMVGGNPSEVLLVSSGADGTIRTWNPHTGQEVAQPLKVHTGPVFGVCSVRSADLTDLASVGADGTVRLWHLDGRMEAQTTLVGHIGGINAALAVQFEAPSGDHHHWLVTGGDDGTLRLWDCKAGGVVGDPLSPSCITQVVGHPEDAPSEVYAMSAAGKLLRWNPERAVAAELRHSDVASRILSLSKGASGSSLFVVTGTGGAFLLDGDAGHEQSLGTITGGPISSLAQLSVAPLTVAMGHSNGVISIRKWDASHGEGVVADQTAHDGVVTSLAALQAPGSNMLISGGSEGTLKLWSSVDLEQVGRPTKAHNGRVWSILASHPLDSSYNVVASCGADGAVCLWNLDSAGLNLTHRLSGHIGDVHALSIMRDEDGLPLLISGGHDCSIRFWDVTKAELRAVVPLGEPIHALGPVQDGDGLNSSTRMTVGTSNGLITLMIGGALIHDASST